MKTTRRWRGRDVLELGLDRDGAESLGLVGLDEDGLCLRDVAEGHGRADLISALPSLSLSLSWEVVSFLFPRNSRSEIVGPLDDGRRQDDALRGHVLLERHVLEEPGVPELREVLLDELVVVRVAGLDAEVEPDRLGRGRLPPFDDDLDELREACAAAFSASGARRTVGAAPSVPESGEPADLAPKAASGAGVGRRGGRRRLRRGAGPGRERPPRGRRPARARTGRPASPARRRNVEAAHAGYRPVPTGSAARVRTLSSSPSTVTSTHSIGSRDAISNSDTASST